jgi:hypothetical protein
MAMSPRLLRPRATGFNPKSIPGLALWLDGSSASSVTLNGSTVSQWNDLSGNGRHATQATAASQPTFTSNARNGRSALTFGGSQTMSVAAFPVTRHMSGAVVVSFGGNGQAVFQRGALNDVHALFVEANVIKARNIGAVNDATTAFSTSTFYVIGFEMFAQFEASGSATTNLRLNGASSATSSYTSSAFGALPSDKSLLLGALAATTYRLNGTLCELVYYQGTSALPTSSLSRVERYLGAKWGVTVS